ncbi:ABC transporter permease protein [Thermus sp. CCB_US3_UF1]|uniref:ABC transporter permease n=1 Tax=unclassified Thermus TaxID=2619321 RepID=UPI0002389BB4|nr:ABC transporter permease protein [Thermus sp. CCB_US3_UF1]
MVPVRYLRVFLLFLRLSLAAEMEYRLNFLLGLLSSFLTLLGALFGLGLLYQGGYRPGGWAWEEALLVLAAFTLLQGLASTLLAPNLNKIVEHVQQGTLDFVLLKPVDPQFWLSLRAFSPWGLGDFLLGLGLLLWGGVRLGLALGDYLLFALYAALGGVMLYSLWFLLATTSIWFVKIYNVTEVLRGLLEAGRFPASAYPALYRVFFTFVVPVAFLTTVPAEAALGRGQGLWGAAGATLALFLLSRGFFRLALRSYTSASS